MFHLMKAASLDTECLSTYSRICL